MLGGSPAGNGGADHLRSSKGGVCTATSTVHVIPRLAPVRDHSRGELDYAVENGSTLLISNETKDAAGQTDAEVRSYSYAAVLGPETSEDQVFGHIWENAHPKLSQGYNCTVMCYGQTGGGKTHTLAGLLPRMASAYFGMLEGADVRAEVSYLQIHMDNVYDLLAGSRENRKGEVVVWKNCSPDSLPRPSVGVASVAEALDAVQRGNRYRTFSSHALNDRSSRSHTLFFLTLIKREKGVPVSAATLTLVDLAGSERVSRTKSRGAVFDEGRSINMSLTCLRTVVERLSRSSETAPTPWRDNVLTMYLKESLSNAYLALIICCSTHADDSDETKCSLQFGSVAKKVQITRRQAEVAKLRKREREYERKAGDAAAACERERKFVERDFEQRRLAMQAAHLTVQHAEGVAEGARDRLARVTQDNESALQRIRVAEASLAAARRQLEVAQGDCAEAERRGAAAAREREAAEAGARRAEAASEKLEHSLKSLELAAEEHLALIAESGFDPARLADASSRLAALREGLSSNEGEMDRLLSELAAARAAAVEAERNEAAAAADAEWAQAAADDAKRASDAARSGTLQGPLRSAVDEMQALEEALEEARQGTDSARARADAATAEVADCHADLEHLRFALSVAETKAERLRLRAGDAAGARRDQEAALADAVRRLEAAKRRAEAELRDLRATHDDMEERGCSDAAATEGLRGEARRLEGETAEQAARVAALRARAADDEKVSAAAAASAAQLRHESSEARRFADVTAAKLTRARREAAAAEARAHAAEHRAAKHCRRAEELRQNLRSAESELAQSGAIRDLPPDSSSDDEASASEAISRVVQSRSGAVSHLRGRAGGLQEAAAAAGARAERAEAEAAQLEAALRRAETSVAALEREGVRHEAAQRAAEESRAAAEEEAERLRADISLRGSRQPADDGTESTQSDGLPAEEEDEEVSGRLEELGRREAAVKRQLAQRRAAHQALMDRSADMEVAAARDDEECEVLSAALSEVDGRRRELHSRAARLSCSPAVRGAVSASQTAALGFERSALRAASADAESEAARLDAARVELADAADLVGQLRQQVAEATLQRAGFSSEELARTEASVSDELRRVEAGAEEAEAAVAAAVKAYNEAVRSTGERSAELTSRCNDAKRRLREQRDRAEQLRQLLVECAVAKKEAEEAVGEQAATNRMLAGEKVHTDQELLRSRKILERELMAAAGTKRALRRLETRAAELSESDAVLDRDNERLREGIRRMHKHVARLRSDVREEKTQRVRAMRLAREVGGMRRRTKRIEDQGRTRRQEDSQSETELKRKRRLLMEVNKQLERERGERRTTHDMLSVREQRLELKQSELRHQVSNLEKKAREFGRFCSTAERQRRRRNSSTSPPACPLDLDSTRRRPSSGRLDHADQTSPERSSGVESRWGRSGVRYTSPPLVRRSSAGVQHAPRRSSPAAPRRQPLRGASPTQAERTASLRSRTVPDDPPVRRLSPGRASCHRDRSHREASPPSRPVRFAGLPPPPRTSAELKAGSPARDRVT